MTRPTPEPAEIIQPQFFCRSRKFSFAVNRYRLPNGVVADLGYIAHPGGAVAVPVTNTGEFVLVRQYRFAAQGRLLEFPAGTLEPNEPADVTIKRELEEETGYRALAWETLGQFYVAPGYSDEIIYAFLAQKLEKLTTPPPQDEDEDIEVVLMSPEALEDAIYAGEIADAKTISAYFLTRQHNLLAKDEVNSSED
ncbi:NUDIX hydrolase [Synechococcus sp. PCC 6312]|uniref:NUDIX hydrolase n=1 Tax=Synechococcus sp. (strain ATCC 27167 / PCC 6312) TaxID=195253 RepID=UPI00029EF663|nr:NUDIX hydrolase [Synechococcus sp. PCC 6312]AFY62154.1 NTP pyrophosphohydrolase [Synechococcus sp. PCC 6312]